MIKKEIREASMFVLMLIYAGVIVSLLTLLSAVLRKKPFDVEFNTEMTLIFIIGGSIFYGLSAFIIERAQKGTEYLLTLPYSRLQLLVMKLVPRLAGIIIVEVLFCILYPWREIISLQSLLQLFALALVLFFLTFSISASSVKVEVLIFFSFIILFFYGVFIYLAVALSFAWKSGLVYLSMVEFNAMRRGFSFSNNMTVFIIALMIAPLFISFVLVFRRFDAKAAALFNRKQIMYFIPMFFVSFCLATVIFNYSLKRNYVFLSNSYLTSGQQLLTRCGYEKALVIHDENSVHWIQDDLQYAELIFGENQYLYYRISIKGLFGIARLDLNDYIHKIIYKLPWQYLYNYWPGISYYEGEFVLLTRIDPDYDNNNSYLKSDSLRLVFIDGISGGMRHIDFKSTVFDNYCAPYIIGIDRAGERQFWLIASKCPQERSNVVRLWEDGQVEDLGVSTGWACYAKHLLFFSEKNSQKIYQLQDSGIELVKVMEGMFYMPFCNLVGATRELIVIKERKLFRLDENTLDLEEIGDIEAGSVSMFRNEFMLRTNYNEKWSKLYRIDGTTMTLLKHVTGVDHAYLAYNALIVIKEEGVTVYSLPDLKELRFKYLQQ